MPTRNNATSKPKKSLDTISGKRGRGRPGVRRSLVSGRAYNYQQIFNIIWNNSEGAQGETLRGVGDDLVKAQTEEEVIRAFDPWPNYQRDFAPLAGLILEVLRDKDFPKRPRTQMRFLADSLAGSSMISPRTSRDICEKERAKEKRAHRILRFEWYIECSCRYKGKSRDHACPKCGAKIDFGFGSIFDYDG